MIKRDGVGHMIWCDGCGEAIFSPGEADVAIERAREHRWEVTLKDDGSVERVLCEMCQRKDGILAALSA